MQPNASYTGTVSALSTSSITISTDDGDITIELTDDTTFSREFGMGGQQPGSMGEMPSDMGQMGGETPPEKPDGEAADAGNQESTPPELPEGDAANGGSQGGMSPEMPQGEAGEMGDMESMNPLSLTAAGIALGDTVTVQTDETGKAASVTVSGGDMNMQMPGGNMGMPGAMASGVDSYDAATEFTADASESGIDYTSTAKDENTIHVYEGASVTLEDSVITRNSSDSTGGDTSNFYGVGAAALVTDGTLSIANSTINSDAAGGAGVFA